MYHRFTSLFVLLTLAGCDAQDPAVADPGGTLELTQPLPDVTLDAATMQARTVSLKDVFHNPTRLGLTYEVAVEGPAVTAQIVGEALLLTPLKHGAATVTVTAHDAGGRAAHAQFQARLDVPEQVEVLRTPADTALRVDAGPGLHLALSTVFRQAEGRPLAYRVQATPATLVGATLKDDSLIVQAAGEGTARIALEAEDRGRVTAVAFSVSTTARWCPSPAPGYVDYAQLHDGQTLRFSYVHRQSSFNGSAGMSAVVEATTTWHLNSLGCLRGIETFSVDERFAGTYTTTVNGVETVRRDTTVARTFSLQVTPARLTIVGYPTRAQIAPFHPESSPVQVSAREGSCCLFGVDVGSTLLLGRTQGLLAVGSWDNGRTSGNSWRLTRVPD